MTQLAQVFQTPDGQVFNNRADAERHLRAPQIKAALLAVAGGSAELAAALFDNESDVSGAFESGTIKRVTKAERNKLKSEMDKLVATHGTVYKFIAENANDIVDSFRWPTQTRLTDEEKASLQRRTLLGVFDGDEKVVALVIQEKDKILAAYGAGKPERKVSNAAQEGLALYRAMKDAEKRIAELKASEGPISAEELKLAQQAFDNAKAALEARKAARAAANENAA